MRPVSPLPGIRWRAGEREGSVISFFAFLLIAFAAGAFLFTGSAHGGLANTVFIVAVIGFLLNLIYLLERRLHPPRHDRDSGPASHS